MTPAVRSRHALLTVAEMARADALAIAGGVAGATLMENAGAAVAGAITARWLARPVTVLCGPGNNGGDGFVVARLLSEAGWPVRLALLGVRAALRGDAAGAAAQWPGPVEPADPSVLDGAELVVDALFGAGLSRPLDGGARLLVDAMSARRLAVIAVDVPSGIDGNSGAVLGEAPRAALTVTFFRKKPGHLLLPGRIHCGELVVADIGIPGAVLDGIAPKAFENHPALWQHLFPWPQPDSHKYRRGHVLIQGGGRMTGAARLAARAAMRAGAGLVTVAAPPEAFAIYAASLTGALVEPVADDTAFAALLQDRRRTGVLLGPGSGVSESTRSRVLAALDAGCACVLDADALTAFAGQAEALWPRLSERCLLTPHDGEFARLFGALPGDKLARTRSAAVQSGAVVLLKGCDTVVAGADGTAVINCNAPPQLATGGAGDVLAGLALGLLGQGMAALAAAAAAAWLHGAAAAAFGPGLIAEDLPDLIPAALRALRDPP